MEQDTARIIRHINQLHANGLLTIEDIEGICAAVKDYSLQHPDGEAYVSVVEHDDGAYVRVMPVTEDGEEDTHTPGDG